MDPNVELLNIGVAQVAPPIGILLCSICSKPFNEGRYPRTPTALHLITSNTLIRQYAAEAYLVLPADTESPQGSA